jgi:RimJ/RimL family protein N-acetyltransferase
MKPLAPFDFPSEISGERIVLRKPELSLAAQMFRYVDRDRKRLGRFLPWVPGIISVKDEEAFIRLTHEDWKKKIGFGYGIFERTNGTYMGNIGVFDLHFNAHRNRARRVQHIRGHHHSVFGESEWQKTSATTPFL